MVTVAEGDLFVDAKGAPLDGIDGETVLRLGAFLRTAQMAGALSACLELCIRYAQERSQFGRPIRKFQAIQHQIALLAEEAAAVTSASRAAATALDRGDASFELACTKLRANQAAGPSALIAHQVHGAIGITKEHSLHRFTQRLWTWRSEFGNDRHWARWLGRFVLSEETSSPWSLLTSRERT
jgi:acyl-CoA dehydrogenase